MASIIISLLCSALTSDSCHEMYIDRSEHVIVSSYATLHVGLCACVCVRVHVLCVRVCAHACRCTRARLWREVYDTGHV
jgi:hypothetical protein